MRIHVPKEWALPQSAATSEADYTRSSRREFLKAMGVAAAGTAFLPSTVRAATSGFPAPDNPDYPAGALKITPFSLVSSYNNFYEFGLDKGDPVVEANKGWKTEPWTVEIAGMVANPGKWDVEDLVKKMGGIEQRVYRHRCVEAWSMVIPWDGFPLAKLVDMAAPTAQAKYLRFTSFMDPKSASGQRGADDMGWPYVEGLHINEARNELAMIATGIFGKPIPNQNGAPLRLVTPWKYGFKGIKSIVRIEFTDQRPLNTWQRLAPNEYGFFANVNPAVDHPRWSQASERVIGGGFFSGRQPTLLYNGYEKQVAELYKGIDPHRLY